MRAQLARYAAMVMAALATTCLAGTAHALDGPDTSHGRIYRVTYPSRPLVKPAKVAGATVAELLENLKLPEYRTRYRTRRELAGHPATEVLPAVT